MNGILDGKLTAVEFARFLEETVPEFYAYGLHHKLTLMETLKILHIETFCNEKDVFQQSTSLNDEELHRYLHSMKLAVTLNVSRLEILYGGLSK